MRRSGATGAALLFCCLVITDLAGAACPSSFVELGSSCYLFFDNSPGTFLEAREVCQDLGADLAMVKDCNELKLIAGYIELSGAEVAEGYWVGGTDVLDGSFQWIDGTYVQLGAPFWGRIADSPKEPSGGTLENCAYMATGEGLYFHDGDCEEPTGMAPLCQVESLGLCPEPYVAIAGGCYQFLTELEETWSNARYICQASAGDLAVIDDCNVMASIINYALTATNETLPTKGYWIGATDVETEDAWVWVNGAVVDLGVPFWGAEGEGPLQPDDTTATQNCLELWARDRYYFNDVECAPTGDRAPLCQIDPL